MDDTKTTETEQPLPHPSDRNKGPFTTTDAPHVPADPNWRSTPYQAPKENREQPHIKNY